MNLFPATRTLLWSCLPCKELFKYFDKKVKYICIHFESDRLECDRIVPPRSFHIWCNGCLLIQGVEFCLGNLANNLSYTYSCFWFTKMAKFMVKTRQAIVDPILMFFKVKANPSSTKNKSSKPKRANTDFYFPLLYTVPPNTITTTPFCTFTWFKQSYIASKLLTL